MISDKALKCPKCGCLTTNKEKEKPVTQETPKVQPVYYEENDKAKSNKTLYTMLGMLIAALIGLGLWMWQSEMFSGNGADSNVVDSSDDIKTESLDAPSTSNSSSISSIEGTGFNEVNSNIPTGFTFRTFTEEESDGPNSTTYQSRLPNTQVTDNLKECGFVLSDTKTESRLDYTGDNYYDVTIETYAKTVNGQVTTVKLESDYTEIHFPNLSDLEEFKNTIRACSLKETEDGFEDSEEVYWAGTDVSIKGTIVTLNYRWEP